MTKKIASNAKMSNAKMAPDAQARDAMNRELAGKPDDVLRDLDFTFITKNVDPAIKAAIIAVLVAQREAETDRVKLVERRDREPWARSQLVPEGISDFLTGNSSV